MNDALVFDVTEADFERAVVDRSRTTPVLVDFWAAWCGPCRTLAPVLDRLASAYEGRFVLAKVDTEANGGLAARYAIRSLPTVALFAGGEIVAQMVGAQPESALRAMLDEQLPRPSDEAIGDAVAQLEAGRPQAARELLEAALAADPENDRLAPALAGALIELGDTGALESLVATVPAARRLDRPWPAIEARLSFAREASGAPDEDALRERVAAAPGDTEARFLLASRHAAAGRFDDAAEGFLDVLRRDRRFRDDGARTALVAIFEILGDDDPRVRDFRSRMAAALF